MWSDLPSRGVNGALWTLVWEIRAYVLLAIIGLVGALNRRWAIAVIFFGCWIAFSIDLFKYPGLETSPAVVSGLRLLTFFFAGVLCYVCRALIPVRWQIFCGALLLLVGAVVFGVFMPPYSGGLFYVVAPIPLAYVTIYLGIRLNITRINSVDDRSYGVYIYGSLFLNILADVGLNRAVPSGPKMLNWAIYVSLALALSFAMATLSWYCVEKPAIGLKEHRPWRRLMESNAQRRKY